MLLNFFFGPSFFSIAVDALGGVSCNARPGMRGSDVTDVGSFKGW